MIYLVDLFTIKNINCCVNEDIDCSILLIVSLWRSFNCILGLNCGVNYHPPQPPPPPPPPK